MRKYIDGLKNIGLQEYESKAYYILLTHGILNAKDISLKAEIPQSKVYTILPNLIKKGFCTRVPGHKNKFKALKPNIAFSLIQNAIDEKQHVLNKVANNLEELCDSNTKELIDDYIEILKDKNQIHKKYLELVDKAEKEILFFSKGPYACDTKLKAEEQNQYVKAFCKRGGRSKELHEIDKFADDPDYSSLILMEGQQARIADSLPVKMIIFDGKIVMFTLEEPHGENELTMLAIEHKSIALACIMLFNSIWINAKEIKNKKEDV